MIAEVSLPSKPPVAPDTGLFPSSLIAQYISDMTESAKKLLDTETKFQLQPSSSTEAPEMLIGAGLDRVQANNLLTGVELHIRPEDHGTRTPHGSGILLPSNRKARHPPVRPKWQPVRAHGVGNSGQVRRTT